MIGLEVGISVASIGIRNESTGCATYFNADVVAEAKRNLKVGEILDGEGGYTVVGQLTPAKESVRTNALPLGLAQGWKLKKSVGIGEIIRWEDVVIDETNTAVRCRKEMEAAFCIVFPTIIWHKTRFSVSLAKKLNENLAVPVIGAPLFIIGNPDLVVAQCKAGIIGSFPALNARPAEELDLWLKKIKRSLEEFKKENPETKVAPFAVNQIIHASNKRLKQDMDACVKYKVPIIITSLSEPGAIVRETHSYGGLVFHDVISIKHAKKAIDAGVDGLILVGGGCRRACGNPKSFCFRERG